MHFVRPIENAERTRPCESISDRRIRAATHSAKYLDRAVSNPLIRLRYSDFADGDILAGEQNSWGQP